MNKPLAALALAASLAATSTLAAPTNSTTANPTATATATTTSATTTTTKLRGVDPASYRQKRNGKPDVLQELKALPADVAVAVLANPGAFLVEAGQSKAQRALERRALVQGALASLAQRDDARAPALLEAHIADDDVAIAAVALQNLGRTHDAAAANDAIATLSAVLFDERAGLERRSAAAAGLGHLRSETALTALLPALALKNDDLKIATLQAITNLCSRWAFEARASTGTADERATAKATGEALRARARDAVSSLDGSPAVLQARDQALGLLR